MTGRIIHVTSHTSQGSDDYDGTSERPVLTFGKALLIAKTGDAIAYDGMLGTMVPAPATMKPRRQKHADRIANALLWLFLTGAAVVLAFSFLWLAAKIIIGIAHHPVGGSLICGSLAIVGYVWYCKRHGISL